MSKENYSEYFKLCHSDHFWLKSRFSAFLKIVNKNKIKFNTT